ncbi:vWA domain-containing protein [Cyanobacterium sp. Dongsha4]|uniref:vWA domain-containing protein n=1 Tax=Cyanobacterium sp. DS4 TaxID=2878255 RepID=UPI002E81B531|nr:vWA domain-containing protein [Cyanobacterium sp. Dongsha4]WVK99086.1 VWA domain-containing protein [Cyanobacterium sp. Dongsha4]
MSDYCQQKIAIGEELSPNQLQGLELVSLLSGGRDVVFAIDLTESVNLDDEARVRLKQIITDSLNKGDTVYIVPFSSQVNPTNPNINPLTEKDSIPFLNPQEDIERIIEKIPLKTNLNEKNTDIQLAEHFIYENLAQINQNRLCKNQPIKTQSVVWLTDAPLNTSAGITSEKWIETPPNSPYRDSSTPESQNRQNWINHLKTAENTRQLEGKNYNLTVIDLPATVQEFCTPAPGGKETCFVNKYIFDQLWLSTTILSVIILSLLGGGIFAIKYYLSLKTIWTLKIELPNDEDRLNASLKNKNSLSIGEDIECKGGEIRGYLKREGNKLFIEPTNTLPIIYRDRELRKKQLIEGNIIRLNCPYKDRDFYITIIVSKN